MDRCWIVCLAGSAAAVIVDPLLPLTITTTITTTTTITNTTKSPAVARVEPTILVVTDLEGHPRSMIFMSSERAYATSY